MEQYVVQIKAGGKIVFDVSYADIVSATNSAAKIMRDFLAEYDEVRCDILAIPVKGSRG